MFGSVEDSNVCVICILLIAPFLVICVYFDVSCLAFVVCFLPWFT